MLSLQSPRWAELEHAYGNARDIPPLLLRLFEFPRSQLAEEEPWHTLWSALAHQGDVYSASFAAVPHVVAALAAAPDRADESYFHFPAWVEICRAKRGLEVPEDLRGWYVEALARIPALVVQVANRHWEPDFAACALAAIAASKGHHALAEAALEMAEPGVAEEVLEWRFDQ
jgi:hypothetical protein